MYVCIYMYICIKKHHRHICHHRQFCLFDDIYTNQEDLDIINQARNQEILSLESKIADLQEAIQITLNSRQSNWSKAWKEAINCELN